MVLSFARRLPFLALHLDLRGLPSHGETDAHLLVHGAVVILALRGVLTGHSDTVGPEGLLVRATSAVQTAKLVIGLVETSSAFGTFVHGISLTVIVTSTTFTFL